MTSNKWKDVVDSALQRAKVRKLEWRKFSKDKIHFLEILTVEPITKFTSNRQVKDLLQGDKEFFEECLQICIQQEEQKFEPFLQFIGHSDDFIERVISKLVQMSKPSLLDFVLTNFWKKTVQDNSPILIEACRKDHYDLVKVMVRHGFRLKTSHKHQMLSRWKRYTKMPPLMMPFQDSGDTRFSFFEGGDEIDDLNVLRMMSKRSYILSCYDVVVEDSFEIVDCQCWQWAGKDHHCPADPRFKPSLHCTKHVECNDPIFRCFDLAKLANGFANHVPEYREEYQEIARECSALSVELLDQCNNTEEVQVVLKESSGSSKYFRDSRYMKYPRLRLAIEHNHKEFVGHMYCQQTLRQAWMGRYFWQGAPVIYKLLYLIILVLCAPFSVITYITIGLARSLEDIGEMKRIGEEDFKQAAWPKKCFYWFIYKTRNWHFTLDVPMNRFLIFSGYYVIFVAILMKTILDETVFRASDYEEYQDTFTYPHVILSVFAIAMLFEDMSTFWVIRSISTYFKFWRVFDLFLHLSLTAGLTLRAVRVTYFSSDECLDTKSENDCHLFEIKRDKMDDFEAIFMALAATFALNRIMYWLQYHEKIGPIVINMSRVLRDLVTIGGTYLIICMAFSFGLVFVLNGEIYYNNYARLNSTGPETNLTAYASNFGQTAYLLLWTVLDPGPNEEISDEGPRGTFATLLFLAYQVSSIVILLNLLIAIMNSTVQKFTDRRQLYWKYTKTGSIIEFFDDYAALPIPFSILTITFWFLEFTFRCLRKSYLKVAGGHSSQENKLEGVSMNGKHCLMKDGPKQARKEHADLMMNLIKRFKGKNAMEGSDLKIEQFKQGIEQQINHISTKM